MKWLVGLAIAVLVAVGGLFLVFKLFVAPKGRVANAATPAPSAGPTAPAPSKLAQDVGAVAGLVGAAGALYGAIAGTSGTGSTAL